MNFLSVSALEDMRYAVRLEDGKILMLSEGVVIPPIEWVWILFP
jgi:hypothetical protein